MIPEALMKGGVLDAQRAFDKALAISLVTEEPVNWESQKVGAHISDTDPERKLLRVVVCGKVRWEKDVAIEVLGIVTSTFPKKSLPAGEEFWRLSTVRLSIEQRAVAEYTAAQLANFKFR